MMEISLLKVFLIFLKVGAFTFGGGYAMIPIIERELVEKSKVLKPSEFYDTLVLCQSLPGAIAVNFAVFLGLKLKGYKGAFFGFLGVVLPSFLFILFISMFLFQFIDNPYVEAFFKGVRLSVVALMFLAGYKLLKSNRSFFGIGMITLTLIALLVFNLHPFILVLMGGLSGVVLLNLKEVIHRDHS